MSQEPNIDPRHSTKRAALVILGPTVAAIGLLFTVIGFGSIFFSASRYFWCAFVGLPLLVVGVALSTLVLKDMFNYMAKGTKGGVKTTAQAIGEGLYESFSTAKPKATCPRCRQANDADAKFCKDCGAAMGS
jgi:hypothetical protein